MRHKILIITIIAFGLSGCLKNVLDRKPLNRISDADVWYSITLAELYLVPVYDALPIGFSRGGATHESNMTDEASHPYAGVTVVNNYGNIGLALNTDAYTSIRRINYYLQMIGTGSLTADQVKAQTAEARFLRAYFYFDLAKKYGGMPIITEAQNANDGLETLQVIRNKEDEVYSFVLSELDAAAADLPETRDAANRNRAVKTTALALKARAALYAASIAKFGAVQLNGLIGIPQDRAAFYYTEAFNASKAVIESGKYSLYTRSYDPESGSGDAAANFTAIFTDRDNAEIIFQKSYSKPDKMHSYDTYNYPQSFKPGCCGNSQAPTLEMVESFEFIDNTNGTLDVAGKEFNSPDELFANKDPRFTGTIMRSETPLLGRTVQVYRGIYDQGGTLYEVANTPFPADPSMMQVGRDGPYTLGDVGKTGFYVKKYLTTTEVTPENQSYQNYIDIRLAEMYLTLAEASFEGDLDQAAGLAAINEIRKRAGMPELDAAAFTRARIRNERKVELAYEDKRFWDIRRWRIGTTLFQNTNIHALWPYLKYTGSGYKWTFVKKSGAPLDNGQSRVFLERDYYSNLAGYIATNPKIENNPGW
ncbi:MAG: RagB/SusD family nutrient uptake outer membrane protein [Agriterribacter sp.]